MFCSKCKKSIVPQPKVSRAKSQLTESGKAAANFSEYVLNNTNEDNRRDPQVINALYAKFKSPKEEESKVAEPVVVEQVIDKSNKELQAMTKEERVKWFNRNSRIMAGLTENDVKELRSTIKNQMKVVNPAEDLVKSQYLRLLNVGGKPIKNITKYIKNLSRLIDSKTGQFKNLI
jgi:hypothetical protein